MSRALQQGMGADERLLRLAGADEHLPRVPGAPSGSGTTPASRSDITPGQEAVAAQRQWLLSLEDAFLEVDASDSDDSWPTSPRAPRCEAYLPAGSATDGETSQMRRLLLLRPAQARHPTCSATAGSSEEAKPSRQPPVPDCAICLGGSSLPLRGLAQVARLLLHMRKIVAAHAQGPTGWVAHKC